MSLIVVSDADLSQATFAREWVGGDVPACVIFVDASPGERVHLHRHPYAELFFVLEGTATFEDGERTIEVSAPAFVVVPAGQPHCFSNRADVQLRQIDVHLNGTFDTEWLED
ncbi:MAG TPA: cupin domain-containing protein [Gaiellaceae bacterium]|nr:cupin domain-containing protein [Gaiellaceae bacterium]